MLRDVGGRSSVRVGFKRRPGVGRAPKDIRARIKEIKQAVKVKPTSATSWTLKIRFTFTSAEFAAAFAGLNP